MTCNHAKFCIYLAAASSSIWCCEEFDDRDPVIEQKDKLQEAKPNSSTEAFDVAAKYAKTA